jgi:hypothetical protein
MERSDIVPRETVDFPHRGLRAKKLGKDVYGFLAVVRFHDGITGVFAFAAGIDELLKAPNIVGHLLVERVKTVFKAMPCLYQIERHLFPPASFQKGMT